MLKHLLVILITCFCSIFIASSASRLSDKAQASLLSCYPSNDAVYTKFGHTAIRILDKENEIDLIFNYGIFNFETSGFIPKFIKGETDYQLGISYTNSFIEDYRERGSTVVEQELNLTQIELQKLWDALILNYEPQNRMYRYNFVYDNCATRPCIIINSCCNMKISWGGDKTTTTYRKLIEEFVGSNTWTKFGIDILIGSASDKPIGTHNEKLFLPVYTMKAFATSIITDDYQNRALVKNTTVYEATAEGEWIPPFFLSPIFICSFILLLISGLSFFYNQKKDSSKWLDFLLFFIAGLIGCIIFYLMFFSEHPLVEANWNLLWLHPLQFIFGIGIWFKSLKKILIYYQYINILLLVVGLITFTFHLQQFHTAFLPLIIMLLLRSALFVVKNKD